MPRWVQQEKANEAKEEKDKKPSPLEKRVPEFPIKIYAGMGRKVVRKRKPEIYKNIDYKI